MAKVRKGQEINVCKSRYKARVYTQSFKRAWGANPACCLILCEHNNTCLYSIMYCIPRLKIMMQMDIVCITATCNTDCDMIIQVRGVELFAVLYRPFFIGGVSAKCKLSKSIVARVFG